MAVEFFIGKRYLRSKQKQAFISLITFLSVSGVTVGVMALIVVIAVMAGFEDELKSEISNIDMLVAYTPKELPGLVKKLKHKDLIFIDTVGRSQKNIAELSNFQTANDVTEDITNDGAKHYENSNNDNSNEYQD